jgi:hypothetical protein
MRRMRHGWAARSVLELATQPPDLHVDEPLIKRTRRRLMFTPAVELR